MKTILVDAVFALVIETDSGFSIDEEMLVMLEHFPNRKIVLTGADDDQYKLFNLAQVPYELFTLKHNPEKSDPAYYRTLLAQFGLRAEDVVYFEHDDAAVASAQSVGITTYHYDSAARDIAALEAFLHENL
jgi:FMN phosphatase YigB (HAD superfamily)